MALVVFVFPREAAAVIRHVKNARENDKHALVRLQIHVEWYRGLDIEAASDPPCEYELPLTTYRSILRKHIS